MESIETISDVKPVAESSTATITETPTATSSTATSLDPSLPTATEAKASDKPTIDDILAERAKELLAPESSQDTKAEEKKEDAPTEEQQTEETKAEDPKPDEAKEKDPAAKTVPYDRFTEVNEKAQRLESELRDEKPWADSQRSIVKHLVDHNISQDEFRHWMDIAAACKVDPAKAHELLTPILKSLGDFSGETLTPEFQQMLDQGIPKEVVQRLAKAEAREKANVKRAEFTQRQQQEVAMRQQVQQFVADANAQLTAFEATKKFDVDFTPKKNGEPDGKYELYRQGVLAALQSGAVKQISDIPKVAQQVYDNVTATLSRYAPKVKANGKHVSSTKSNGTTTNGAPKDVDEAMQQMLKRKHGIDWRIPARK